jgi:hypothetical protein
MTQEEREKRMQLFAGFSRQVEAARAGAVEKVSEVDLSDLSDLRATIDGLQGNAPAGGASTEAWGRADAPLQVLFGDSDFEAKYLTLVKNIDQWRAMTGRLESVDLRFNGEAVANPDTTGVSQQVAPKQDSQKPAPARPARKSAARRQ